MRTRILITLIIIVSIVLVVGSVFANKNNQSTNVNLTNEVKAGYSEITAVPGISFCVNTMFIDKATAVTQISDKVNFQKNQYYSYKNGEDKYILFNMDQLIVAAQKGTDFFIDEATEKEQALVNASLMNMWFKKGTKKFDSTTKDGRTITSVTSGVAINKTLYADFCGKLVNITKDGEEWSLFVGVPGERYDKLSDSSKDGINGIIETLTFSNAAYLVNQEMYAVSLSGNSNEKEVVETVEEVFEYDEDSLNLTNQSFSEKEEDKAYTSSPYNMLSIGDNGILSAFNDYIVDYEEPIIKVTNIYTGSEAEEIIKKYCSESRAYEYQKAPDGSSWEVVKYDLCYKNCDSNEDYVNIQFKGLDGEELRYRGIKYSPKTHDIDIYADINPDTMWSKGFYAYYAVPNGCSEYCIEAGESQSVNETEVHAAYIYIDTSEKAEEILFTEDALPTPTPLSEEIAALNENTEID